MPVTDGPGRAQRLRQILFLLTASAGGLTTAELAERTGMTVRTIQRDLAVLQTSEPHAPLILNGRRWALLPGRHSDITQVALTGPESVALCLAARLLDRISDEPNRHVATLLEKLAAAVGAPIGQQLAEDAELILTRVRPPAPATAAFAEVFAALAEGWRLGRRVAIEYASPRKPEPRRLVVEPYLLEPIAPSLAVYCYARVLSYDDDRWLKIERIRGARVLHETFTVPPLNRRAILRSGWGIMGGDEVACVHLRFPPRVTARVKESRWHDSMRLMETDDGGSEVFFEIAHTIEIVPWIRGWGPDCEVIGPTALRAAVAADAERAAALYRETATAERRAEEVR